MQRVSLLINHNLAHLILTYSLTNIITYTFTYSGRPFFLYVPFSHVHTPQFVSPKNAGRSGKTGDKGHFYDSLMELDDTVGQIMAALKVQLLSLLYYKAFTIAFTKSQVLIIMQASGVDNDTIVFVSGDNGPWETKCNLTGSVGPFTGLWQKKEGGGGSSAKTTLWEGGHREVGLARWPSHIIPRVSNATVSTLDILPTIASLAGVLINLLYPLALIYLAHSGKVAH